MTSGSLHHETMLRKLSYWELLTQLCKGGNSFLWTQFRAIWPLPGHLSLIPLYKSQIEGDIDADTVFIHELKTSKTSTEFGPKVGVKICG